MSAGMFFSMSHHAAPLREALAAKIADVRAFAGVGEIVESESIGPCEAFGAMFTLERSFAGV